MQPFFALDRDAHYAGDAGGDANGGIEADGGEKKTATGGPWRKLSRFLLAYPFFTITVRT